MRGSLSLASAPPQPSHALGVWVSYPNVTAGTAEAATFISFLCCSNSISVKARTRNKLERPTVKEIIIKLGLQHKPASRTGSKDEISLVLFSYSACCGWEAGLLGHISMLIAGAA